MRMHASIWVATSILVCTPIVRGGATGKGARPTGHAVWRAHLLRQEVRGAMHHIRGMNLVMERDGVVPLLDRDEEPGQRRDVEREQRIERVQPHQMLRESCGQERDIHELAHAVRRRAAGA